MIGPQGSGKTTLLYQILLTKSAIQWTSTPTTGFQFEEIEQQGDEHSKASEEKKIGVWDIAGSPSSQMVVKQISQLVRFRTIIYVIDPDAIWTQEQGGLNYSNMGCPGSMSHLELTKTHMSYLLTEPEIAAVKNVYLVFNIRLTSDKNKMRKDLFVARHSKPKKEGAPVNNKADKV